MKKLTELSNECEHDFKVVGTINGITLKRIVFLQVIDKGESEVDVLFCDKCKGYTFEWYPYPDVERGLIRKAENELLRLFKRDVRNKSYYEKNRFKDFWDKYGNHYFKNLKVGMTVYVKCLDLKKPKAVKLIRFGDNGDLKNCFFFKLNGKEYFLSQDNFVGIKFKDKVKK